MSEVKVNKISPRSGTAVTLGDSGDKFTVPSGSNITINSGASITNDGTATGFDTDTNDKVKVSTNDTTPGFLNGKLVAGTNITLTEGSDGGDETLTVAASTTPAANSITTAQLAYDPNPFRNIIINGDMSIAQRATSTSSITGNGYHTIDRFNTINTTLGTWTQSQSTDVPTGQGFATSLKMDCTTADASPAAGDRLDIQQKFEGQNLQYLKKGTSSAQSTTLSFWVKSNKTGTYIVELFDSDNTRQISQAYTISSSNTWEKKTLTFAGDTSGALGNDNGNSLQVSWFLAVGSTYSSGTLSTTWTSNTNANRAVGQVNLADSTSNEWYVTGVQLEAGTTASEFEFLPVDVNLLRCQRYYHKTKNSQWLYAINSGNTYSRSEVVFKCTMRATPTATLVFSDTGTGSGAQYENANHITVFVNGRGTADTSLNANSTFDSEL